LDFMPANYFNSTHPDAIFVKQLLIVKHNPLGRKILSGLRLKIIEKGDVKIQDLTAEEIPDVLEKEFGLIQ
ncbi:MAG: arylamine N-acetyltransferase, partial [Moraxellaceae bacterium]